MSDNQKRTWAEYQWDEWVPLSLRKQIEKFWCDSFGRSPDAWIRAHREHVKRSKNCPKHGEIVTFGADYMNYTGRYLYAWGNMCRLVFPDGSYKVFSTPNTPYSADELLEEKERTRQRVSKLKSRIAALEMEIQKCATTKQRTR